MKKALVFLFLLVLTFSAGCSSPSGASAVTATPQTPQPTPVSTPQPTSTPTPTPTATPAATSTPKADTDLMSLISLTRKDVTALYGTGEPVPYADISDYNETSYALPGFPCEYENLGGALVFYDAAPPDDDAAPYYCKEAPTDAVLGIMLPQDSAPYNVNDVTAELNAENLKALKDMGIQVEHVNGMYEYYRVVAAEEGVQYEWISDSPDMSNAALFVSLADAE